MRVFTIGFTQKSAERFFGLLREAGVKRIIDTRLNNRSQLAGFSKAEDLPYFLRVIGGMSYVHDPQLAPTQEMLDRYKKLKGEWSTYEAEFQALLKVRNVARSISVPELEDACLLCSEHLPTHCHRRLVAEYLQLHFPEIEIEHLL